MSLEGEFRRPFEKIVDKFSSDEGVVSLEKNTMGIFICIRLINGEYISKCYWTMFFAKRRFSRLRDKYSKEKKETSESTWMRLRRLKEGGK